MNTMKPVGKLPRQVVTTLYPRKPRNNPSKLADNKTSPLVDGYAWFCKHFFVPNFVGASVGVIPITDSNEHLLKTAYEARTPQVFCCCSISIAWNDSCF